MTVVFLLISRRLNDTVSDIGYLACILFLNNNTGSCMHALLKYIDAFLLQADANVIILCYNINFLTICNDNEILTNQISFWFYISVSIGQFLDHDFTLTPMALASLSKTGECNT